MKLAVVGQEPLSVLKSWVQSKFSSIPNLRIAAPYPPWDPPPFCPPPPFSLSASPLSLYRVVPIKDLRELRLYFPLPSLRQHYRQQPAHYASHLVGHEGAGSILAALKKRNMAHGIVAGPVIDQSDFVLFSIMVQLTRLGEEKWTDVVGIVFQYIDQLQRQGPQQWIYEELRQMAKIEFEMMERRSSLSYALFLSSSMILHSPTDIVSGPYLLHDYDPQVIIEKVLSKLTLSNVLIFLVSPCSASNATQKERFYGTRYQESVISDQTVSSWGHHNFTSELREPASNLFIPTHLNLKDSEFSSNISDSCDKNRDPEIVYSSSLIKIYHKQVFISLMLFMNIYISIDIDIDISIFIYIYIYIY